MIGLHALLQKALGIGGVLSALGRQMWLERTHDECFRHTPTAIEVQCPHQGLVDVLERGMHTAGASPLFRGSQDDHLVDAELKTHIGKRCA